MAIYAVGDIHGCGKTFSQLLKKVHFSKNSDQLYLVGDTINRGPRSLDTILRIMDLQNRAQLVLGNHELGFLAYEQGQKPLKSNDTLQDLTQSRDRRAIVEYFRKASLFQWIEDLQIGIVHAALHPSWSIHKARALSEEVEVHLQDDAQYPVFMQNLFGNEPAVWSEDLKGMDRLRMIVNLFTRTRLMHANTELDFNYNGTLADKPEHLMPWYDFESTRCELLIFGHWAALGLMKKKKAICLDSGCVWKGALSMIRLDDPSFPITSLAYDE